MKHPLPTFAKTAINTGLAFASWALLLAWRIPVQHLLGR